MYSYHYIILYITSSLHRPQHYIIITQHYSTLSLHHPVPGAQRVLHFDTIISKTSKRGGHLSFFQIIGEFDSLFLALE